MNLKDKIIIFIVIVSVVLMGILINADAATGNIMGQASDRNLAELAKTNLDYFIGDYNKWPETIPNDNWFNIDLDSYVAHGSNWKTDSTIAQSSATCLYEAQGWTGGNKYRITNVININYDKNINNYHAWGWWNGGSGEIKDITGTKITQLDIFAQSIYNAYINQKDVYTTTEKSAMKTVFYNGLKSGGFWTINGDNGFNVSTDFFQNANWNGESNIYKDKYSTKTAQDLIYEYSNNTALDYGLDNMDEDSIVNGENITQKTRSADDKYTIFGPFNISFLEKRKINKISIIGETKSWECYANGDIYYSTSHTETVEGDWSNVLPDIPSGMNFYIKVLDEDKDLYEKSSNIKINFYQNEIQTYKARIMLLKVANGSGQNLMVYGAKANDPYRASIEYVVKNNEPVDLTIEKRGEDNNFQSGVNFILNIQGNNMYAQCEQTGSNPNEYTVTGFKYWTDEDTPGVFTTGTDGKIIIKGLDSSRVYTLQESYNDNDGYMPVSIRDDTSLSNGKANIELGIVFGQPYNNCINNIRLSTEQENVLKVYDKKQQVKDKFDINITKFKSGGRETIDGAEFKIKVFEDSSENSYLGWLKQTEDGYIYTANYNNATLWSTNGGKRSITDLDKTYNYEIFETKAATGYKLENQIQANGMNVTIGGVKYNNSKIGYGNTNLENGLGNTKLVFCGRYSYAEYKYGANVQITNVKGKSTPGSSSTTVNVSGVIWIDGVAKNGNNNLYDSGEKVISGATVYLKNMDETYSTSTRTDSRGRYTFTGIKETELSNYYIELAYSGIGSRYSICEYSDRDNGSKAKHQINGAALTEEIDESNREHMNIGLVSVAKSEETLTKEVAYVESRIKGGTLYRYNANNNQYGNLGSVSVGTPTYHKTIYASDIAYSKGNDWKNGSLEVYVTYKITVTNASNKSAYRQRNPREGNIRELNMTVAVDDIYKSDLYEFNRSYGINSNYSWSDGGRVSDEDGDKKATMTVTLAPKQSRELMITFKLTPTALEKVLTDGVFTAKNKVDISGSHKYEVYEYDHREARYKWVNGRRRFWKWVYYYKWSGDKGRYYYDECTVTPKYAPGISFTIKEFEDATRADRTISGRIFQDEIINSTTGEVLGNGRYDTNENLVEKVRVDLLDKDKNIATRYIYDEVQSNAWGINVFKSTTNSVYTDNKGNYTFSGIIPGQYYVRFTYGNGQQSIYRATGNKIEDVTAYNYKSTIIKNNTIKNIIKAEGRSTNYSWYRDSSIMSGYSLAVDNLTDRENLNKGTSKTADIKADTPKLEITLDWQQGNNNAYKKYDIKNMNFGIIQTPKIDLGFEKNITNIKVTNVQGNIIAQGNPATQDIRKVSNLDNKKRMVDGSTYVKIEINNEEIYSSKVEITYAITIFNNSDMNYYGRDYYWFGDANKNEQVAIRIDKVEDYLDKKLKFEKIDRTKIDGSEITTADTNNTISLDNCWNLIYTGKNDGKEHQDTLHLIATRTLSNKEEDMDFVNQAKVITAHVETRPSLVEDLDKHKEDAEYTNYFKYEHEGTDCGNPSEEVYLTVIPPTGIGKVVEYILIAVLSGVVITLGIIFIKKKVL